MARNIHDLLLRDQEVRIIGKKDIYPVCGYLRYLTKIVFLAYRTGALFPSIIKTEKHPVLYQRKINNYDFDCIKKNPYIRSLREVISNDTDRCMVLEWMGQDLKQVKKLEYKPRLLFLKIVARSVLKALTAFADMDGQGPGVHTGKNQDVDLKNILTHDPWGNNPVIKLADLGGLIPAGEMREQHLQSLSIRASEIWKGHALSPACDIWSLGVSLAHFISPKPLFGHVDLEFPVTVMSPEMSQAASSIAKIMQLIGPLARDEDPKYSEEFDAAEALVEVGAIPLSSLGDELMKCEVDRDCVDFIAYLLALDPEKRPTVEQALAHPWLNDTKVIQLMDFTFDIAQRPIEESTGG
ncbi:CMGC protein kinase [Helicocarpus griseus UAMH5409]|uniref:CMGC protein kinase n=1 Tax=Helicocarpus griseus UAMH5409 TaxID=1447875 RepID=A0A2B7Y4M6_9EURO|nr:CMGC protein kinase [Helicocarpus griseus UAMH5409]